MVPNNFDMQDWLPIERAEYHQIIAALHAQLDDGTFAAAWAEGRAMSLDQAIEYALGGNGSD